MWVVSVMRSVPGRVLRMALGLWLIAYGATQASLVGLVLMMVGVVPLVTALAGIGLTEKALKGRQAYRAPARGPRERQV